MVKLVSRVDDHASDADEGATASADLGDYGIRMPGSTASVEVALGFERRTEKLDFEADQAFESLAGIGQPIRPVNGRFTVNEVFGVRRGAKPSKRRAPSRRRR